MILIKPKKQNANVFRGSKLKELKRKAGYTYIKLSRILDVSKSTVEGWCQLPKGNRNITQEREQQLCELFSVPLNHFRID